MSELDLSTSGNGGAPETCGSVVLCMYSSAAGGRGSVWRYVVMPARRCFWTYEWQCMRQRPRRRGTAARDRAYDKQLGCCLGQLMMFVII